MEEEWKWVKGFEGVYQISNMGRLKSFKKYSEGYVLSNKNQYGDYLSVVLEDARTNKRRHTRIHVLVVETFIGIIPRGWHVHHKDGNKTNNILTNLEIVHPKEHRKKTEEQNPQIVEGLVNYNKFVKPRRIYQYDKNGNFIAQYANAKIASFYTGVCARNILQVASETPFNNVGATRKQAGGYVWKFSEVINA